MLGPLGAVARSAATPHLEIGRRPDETPQNRLVYGRFRGVGLEGSGARSRGRATTGKPGIQISVVIRRAGQTSQRGGPEATTPKRGRSLERGPFMRMKHLFWRERPLFGEVRSPQGVVAAGWHHRTTAAQQQQHSSSTTTAPPTPSSARSPQLRRGGDAPHRWESHSLRAQSVQTRSSHAKSS